LTAGPFHAQSQNARSLPARHRFLLAFAGVEEFQHCGTEYKSIAARVKEFGTGREKAAQKQRIN